MIIVTGATGQLGRRIVQHLVKRTPAGTIGVSVRDPEKAHELVALGVRVRKGDFADAASLKHAFEGASQVLLVSSNAASTGGDPIAQHRTAIDVAKSVGATRLLYTSQISSSSTSAFAPGQTHGATEVLLRESGLPFTALRNGFYASHALGILANAIKAGELVAPEDGPFSWTSHDDLAEGTAALLLSKTPIDGSTAPLTGFEALDFTGLAALASSSTGREIRRITVTDDQYVERMVKAGQPERVARFALGMFIAARRGEFATVDPTLERLIGHKPRSLGSLLTA